MLQIDLKELHSNGQEIWNKFSVETGVANTYQTSAEFSVLKYLNLYAALMPQSRGR